MTTRKQWATYMSLGFLGILAAWVLYYNYSMDTPAASTAGGADWSWLSYSVAGIPAYKLLVALIAGLILLRLLNRWLPASTGTLAVPGKMLKRIVTVALAFTVLNLALYLIDPTVPLFTTPEGYGHLAFYVVLFIIAAMIDANLEGKTKIAALVMLLITFALIGPRTGTLLSPDGRLWTKLHLDKLQSWSSANTNHLVVAPPAAPVRPSGPPTGVTLTAVLGSVPIELNPGGSYHIRLDEQEPGCVKAYDPSNRPLGSDCAGDVYQKDVRAAKFVSASGKPLRVNYVLTPRWTQ